MKGWRELRGRIGGRVRRLTGADDVAATRRELATLRDEISASTTRDEDIAELAARIDELAAMAERLDDYFAVEIERRRIKLDALKDLQRQLEAVRVSPDYEAAYDEREPLVSVRIASHDRTRQLMDVALPSVLEQTYPHFEIVIVNDGPNKRTRRALEELDDPRIRYGELPERGRYPEHPLSRWRVAGTPAGNRGLELVQGRWIAPLDDDDMFTTDHLERLLTLAREKRAELAYGALLQRNLVTGDEAVIWSDPPTEGAFSPQGAIYHASLSFFTYEPLAWTVHEPGDWNLTRRMLQAGVRSASTKEIVGTLHYVPVHDKTTHPWAAPS